MIKDLRLVEIELFSYCNRKCRWCPNSIIDRTNNVEIDSNILLKLLNELKDNNYNGAITFSRYNEPMSHIDIFKSRLQLIKDILPNIKLISNTNGDFITSANLDGLFLDELTIMDYDRLGLDKCTDRLISAGVIIDNVTYPYIYGHKGSMQILYFVDWLDKKKITDRGGFLKEFSQTKRLSSCSEPIYFTGINHDGTVSPCCNIRNDVKQLKPYILGDLNHNSLFEILNSKKANEFKDYCLNAAFHEGSPCYFCSNIGGRYTRGGAGINYE